MHVLNVHERELPVEASDAGLLIDTLASGNDVLWPKAFWPPMRLDRPLGVGAVGGHGPIPYIVEEFRPAQMVKFRFLGPRGFHGFHWIEILATGDSSSILRHTIDMRAEGPALLTWPLIVRPLHDALLEDALAQAQAFFGVVAVVHPWSPWVKFLRWVMSGGQARSQQVPNAAA